MSGSIYVLLWSTGAVKVGRSDTPAQRIKQHEQAAAGFGVTLQASQIVACADSHHAEQLLIEWAGAQAVQVTGREWLVGISYAAACDFAQSLAEAVPDHERTLKAFLKSLPSENDRRDFAARCQTSLGHLRNLIYDPSKAPAPALCVRIELHSAGVVMRQDLRDDWRDIWPELTERAAA